MSASACSTRHAPRWRKMISLRRTRDLAAAEELLGGGRARSSRSKNDLAHGGNARHRGRGSAQRGDAALAAGRLLGDDSASALYQRVLDADASNALATSGLKKVAEGAGSARARRDRAGQCRSGQSAHRGAGATVAEPSGDSRTARGARARCTRPTAGARSAAGAGRERSCAPARSAGADGALALFQAALKRDPNNARAKAGLRKVGLAFADRRRRGARRHNNPPRRKAAASGRGARRRQADLKARAGRACARCANARHRQATRASRRRPNQASIDQLLDEARQSRRCRQPHVEPGGAYDKYRAVLRIDGNNAKAFAGLSRIPVRAQGIVRSGR